jgi:hypothetical protein
MKQALCPAYVWVAAVASLVVAGAARGSDPARAFAPLAAEYAQAIRPLLARYCTECHATADPAGELDLEQFARLEDVRRSVRTWEKVAEMLELGQMPPEDAPQPNAAETKLLREWVERYLHAEAAAAAGDPGRVVLRRLSNVELDRTVRDLTGVDLRPTREFPEDAAAGEGFTNSGEALVMSPALFSKYLDAARDIAAHAVLLPDGLRFSAATTREDWTNEILAELREIYGRYTVEEGRLPLERYLHVLLSTLPQGEAEIQGLADQHGLSARYLQTLWELLAGEQPRLPLVESLRLRFRQFVQQASVQTGKQPTEVQVAALLQEIRLWQQELWRYNTVGHFKTWQEPRDPLLDGQRLSLTIPADASGPNVVVRLWAGTAGDDGEGDLVLWRAARFEAPGRPTLLARDLPRLVHLLQALRATALSRTSDYLALAAACQQANLPWREQATERGLDSRVAEAWLNWLGISTGTPAEITGHLTGQLTNVGGYAAVTGWGRPETPSLIANSADVELNVPGTVPAHGVAVHPSPGQFVAVVWQSPIEGSLRVQAEVADAHAACGNGVSWQLEVRRGTARARLAGGEIENGATAEVPLVERLLLRRGDAIWLLVGARNHDHVCDLTRVNLTITEHEGQGRVWSLWQDVADDVLAGNPHADCLGNAAVWHVVEGPDTVLAASQFEVPAGSLLAAWLAAAGDPALRERLPMLGEELHALLNGPRPQEGPDAQLYDLARALDGPLFGRLDYQALLAEAAESPLPQDVLPFGQPAGGLEAGPADLLAAAPHALAIEAPAELVRGRTLVVDAALHPQSGGEGTVQLRLLAGDAGGLPENALLPGLPVLTLADSPARQRMVAACAEHRAYFPPMACYARIVPVDEVITLVLFHREDEHLLRLLATAEEARRLDRLWEELRYVSQDAIRVHQAFDMFIGFASQENRVAEFEPLREPIRRRAADQEKTLEASHTSHLRALFQFADRAWRRPLTPHQRRSLAELYHELRAGRGRPEEALDHDQAVRMVLARILVAPSFLYRVERPAAGETPQPLDNWELASRLSYFLWASMPDERLRSLADEGKLTQPELLAAEARRMLQDERVRGLATEFACQWLDVRHFDVFDGKSERYFPTFADLRDEMYEETVRFLTDLFQRDGSVLELLAADHTFVNEALARHYEIPGVTGEAWRRIDGVQAYGRGGILGMASTLAKQSGASRTSPILRGNWIVEVLLGEKLPKPPKNVPQLPESETDTDGLTVRELVERHRSVAQCAVCHERIDPFGLALEKFDAIGRRRDHDLAGRPVDASTRLADGTEFADLEGLRQYLLQQRRDDFIRQFCRKLLGYALGRSVQLSDRPLLESMQQALAQNDYRFSVAIEKIVSSTQFTRHRGQQADEAEDVSMLER